MERVLLLPALRRDPTLAVLTHPRVQSGVRGYDKVEEYDPMERMKRLATGPAVSSLEEELKHMQKTVDVHDFEYKPVPRTDGEDE